MKFAQEVQYMAVDCITEAVLLNYNMKEITSRNSLKTI